MKEGACNVRLRAPYISKNSVIRGPAALVAPAFPDVAIALRFERIWLTNCPY
jgi:hypothetical protein